MSREDFVLQWRFRLEEGRDLRTVNIYKAVDNSESSTHLYKFLHIGSGTLHSVTTFHRFNFETGIWELAGDINWTSDLNAIVHFGVSEVHIMELRRRKKASSQSRRFKVGSSEYKWKVAENNTDLFCVDSRGRTVATWNQESRNLTVKSRVEEILDRLVVTCLIHLWYRNNGRW